MSRRNDSNDLTENSRNNSNRRDVIWFNPPYNIYCSTDVGKHFRNLIEKHFIRGTDLGKLFNRNKLKISYSCLPNLRSKIAAHNRRVLFGGEETIHGGGCNCHTPMECVMEGECKISDIIYKAEVLKEGEGRGEGHAYIGMASGEFKRRWYNHRQSFRDEGKEKSTELAKFIWNLKRWMINYTVHFETLEFTTPYRRETGSPRMCIQEKIAIIKSLKDLGARCLNRREELFRNCVHRYRHLLGTINTRKKDWQPHSLQAFLQRLHSLEEDMERAFGSTRSGNIFRDRH